MKDEKIKRRISPEFKLLLQCRMGKESEKIALEQLLDGKIDWDVFMEMAMHHRIYPLVYKALSTLDHSKIPEKVIIFLKQEYRNNAAMAVTMAAEMARIVKCFKENGIETLVLKGGPLALKLYGDLSLRPFRDIDMVVELKNLEMAERLLNEQGYFRIESDYPLSGHLEKAHLEVYQHYKFFNNSQKTCVELHWKIHCTIDLVTHELSDFCNKEIEIGGVSLSAMAEEELLIYLIAHGSNHMWFRLRWLCDIERLIVQNKRLDWNRVRALSEKYGLRTNLRQGIILLNRIFGMAIPDPMVTEIHIAKKGRKMAEQIITKIFCIHGYKSLNNSSSARELISSTFYRWRLSCGWRNKLSFLAKLCIPNRKDMELIKLPKWLYPLYYILRPFGWALRRAKRRNT